MWRIIFFLYSGATGEECHDTAENLARILNHLIYTANLIVKIFSGQWHNYIEANEAAASVEIRMVGVWLKQCYSSLINTQRSIDL